MADAVRFLGAVPDEQRDMWLRRADLLAMPSRLPGGGLAGEGFGIVYLEAAAYGKPVVAGNVAGALDAVARRTRRGCSWTPPIRARWARRSRGCCSTLTSRGGWARRARARARGFAWPVVRGAPKRVLLEQAARVGG